MHGCGIVDVRGRVIVADSNVARVTVLVIDDHGGGGRAKRDEGHVDAGEEMVYFWR